MKENLIMKNVFNDLYKRLISESPYDSFSQRYWLQKSRETELMRKNGELDLEEDEIEIVDNEFEGHLSQGAYRADITGTIEGNTIHWEISDYNSDFDGPLGIEIDGESEGTREIGEGQTAEDVLNELYEEFKEAFSELDIDEYAEDDLEDELSDLEDDELYDELLGDLDWDEGDEVLDEELDDMDYESVKPSKKKKVIKEDAYDSFSQNYWLEKSREQEEDAELEEDPILINSHNEFEAHLRRGAYSADLTGEIDKTDGTIRWEVKDYNSDFDGELGININGETEGERHPKSGQTINMVLDNLYAEFKDAFEELDIDEFADGDDWDD